MDIYRQAAELKDRGEAFALALVVHSRGSTPQKAGVKAILDASGKCWGTVGGGLVEAEALSRMARSLNEGTSEVFEFRLDEPYTPTAGPICGGVMHLFILGNAEAYAEAYRQALQAAEEKDRGVLVTELDPGSEGGARVSWHDAESSANGSTGELAAAVEEALRTGEARWLQSVDNRDVFVEPITPAPRLIIVGGGHVGQAVAAQSVQLGFDVTVLDDREEYARAEYFPPEVKTISGNVTEELTALPKDSNTYIVIVSKGHIVDALALEGCIHAGVAYLGMIGSTRKVRSLREHFLSTGRATVEEFDRIAAPIGVDIGALTIPEIGVSIAAELIAARRKGARVQTAP